ncbi:MAG: hypothetical protein PHY93_20185 [Bacteriovorax sp.]|nr:hypothetical protein [Bacteriovorax sp.]
MKSNFNKTKRFAPKNNKKRNLGHSLSSQSNEPVKTKPIDIEAIRLAQKKLKDQVQSEENKNVNQAENKNTEKE